MFRLPPEQQRLLLHTFSTIHTHLFVQNPAIRYTLFVEDSADPTFLAPVFRYQTGISDPVAEAQRSNARFARNEGLAGQAWAEPHTLFFHRFPEFSSQEEMNAYYVRKLAVNPGRVALLSSYMLQVRTVMAVGLKGLHGLFLATLSVDLPEIRATIRRVGLRRYTSLYLATDNILRPFSLSDVRMEVGRIRTVLDPLPFP